MHPLIHTLPFVACLLPSVVLGATMYRCEDNQGKVTFTHLGCSPEQTLQSLTINPPPANDIPKSNNAPTRNAPKHDEQHAVFGIGQHDDGCGNRISASQRRKAMIQKEVRPGMTRADVENMLGKPDATSSQNGRVRYNYAGKQDKGHKRSVSFDDEGCVTGKN